MYCSFKREGGDIYSMLQLIRMVVAIQLTLNFWVNQRDRLTRNSSNIVMAPHTYGRTRTNEANSIIAQMRQNLQIDQK